jgi:hypothetical protein
MGGGRFHYLLAAAPELPVYGGWHTRATCLAVTSELPVHGWRALSLPASSGS